MQTPAVRRPRWGTPLTARAVPPLLILLLAGCGAGSRPPGPDIALDPPPDTRVEEVTDTLHGVAVTDPYRWLEDQPAADTRAWVDRQNAHTDGVLSQLPGRAGLRERVTALLRTDTVSPPIARGDRYFLSRRLGDRPGGVITVRLGLEGRDRELVDPRHLGVDPSVEAHIAAVSPDGRLLAYALRPGGSDETEIRFRDVDRNTDLPDTLPPARHFGVAIAPDNRTVYYSRLDPRGSRLVRHRLGGGGSEVILGQEDGPERIITADLSEDGRWLLAHVRKGASGPVEIHLLDLRGRHPWVPLVRDPHSRSHAVLAGDRVVLTTDLDAPNRRLVLVDPARPDPAHWLELVPEDPNAVLRGCAALGGHLLAVYLKDVHSVARIYALDGRRVRELHFDTLGTLTLGSGGWQRDEAFLTFSSFHVPPTIHRLSVRSGQLTVWARFGLPLETDDLELRQVWFTSRDGTRVPMFLLHRRDLRPDGNTPTILTGSGGFGVALTPSFSALGTAWAMQGGVYAVANLRGGGEFGSSWHRAGMLANKQNTFDDFTAAAEWLIANRITRPDRLGILGAANGGLLVGAGLTQRPDLFGAVVGLHPLFDMIRYHLFLDGPFWVPEYGSSDQPDQFRTLLAYSPYHRIQADGRYPAVFLITGEGTSRVAPLHARKMTARLQAVIGPDTPVLLRHHTRTGRGGGTAVTDRIDQAVEILAFFAWRLDLR